MLKIIKPGTEFTLHNNEEAIVLQCCIALGPNITYEIGYWNAAVYTKVWVPKEALERYVECSKKEAIGFKTK